MESQSEQEEEKARAEPGPGYPDWSLMGGWNSRGILRRDLLDFIPTGLTASTKNHDRLENFQRKIHLVLGEVVHMDLDCKNRGLPAGASITPTTKAIEKHLTYEAERRRAKL